MCGSIEERTVGEQLPDIVQPACSVNDDIPSAGCEGLHKKVSPEEPRPLESTHLCSDTLSSLSLGDEFDVNKVSENNTSDLESSDSSHKSGKVVCKRRFEREEADPQERTASKKARTEGFLPNCVDYSFYNNLMQQIREQCLPKILELYMFGFKFKVPFKLELENKSDYPKLIQALDRGVRIDAEVDETNVNQSTEDNDSSTDQSKITHCSGTDKLETNENIPSTLASGTDITDVDTDIEGHESLQNFESVTNKEREETNKKKKCICSDVTETRQSDKGIINERTSELDKNNKERDEFDKNKEYTSKLSKAKQTVDNREQNKASVNTDNRKKSDKERYNIIKNSQYSDISEDEDNSPILNLSTKGVTGNVEGSHIDTPPPGFYHPEVYYNTQAKGKSSCNKKKGKQRKKRLVKRSENNARPSVCIDIPPEIDKVVTETGSGKSINGTRPALKEKEKVQVPLNNENVRFLASIVHNCLYEIEKGTAKPLSNEIKEADETKLPKFTDIETGNSQNKQNRSSRWESTDHEEVKQKLNKKIIMKMKSEGKYALKEQSSAVRIVERVKTEVPDAYFDRVSAIEDEDPDATLQYGFDGPGGIIVKDDNTDAYSCIPPD
ncbi:uncharacterized protein LOC123532457 [Mercenaria mercenaria]|uniref:uncharacterized protein LOC123532457 n=1 Tax=Mercenaria mercenaria TaxID=6596 RepID=UPI00234FA0C0|nr:uncharacterized protein LOC123532457 [Mercenaria mercenaria]